MFYKYGITFTYISNCNLFFSVLLCFSKKLVMEDEAVIALWCCSLSSLEQAVLLLLEHVLSDPKVMHNLETVITDSLLVSKYDPCS